MKFIFLFFFVFTINKSHSQSALKTMPAQKQIEIDSIVASIELNYSTLEKSTIEGEDSTSGNYTAEIFWLKKGEILSKANFYFPNTNKRLLFYYWRSEVIAIFDETEKLYVVSNNIYNKPTFLIDAKRQNELLNFNKDVVKNLMVIFREN